MPLTLAGVGEENLIRKIAEKQDVKAYLENLDFAVGGGHGGQRYQRQYHREREGLSRIAVSCSGPIRRPRG